MSSARRPLVSSYPRVLHGGDYNPDQWLDQPQVLAEDLRLMTASGCNTFSVGIFAWTAYEAVEGQVRFDWLDKVLDSFAERDFKAILATPSGAKPAWMAKKYPETRRVDREGNREPYRDRHNHCWTSPIYRQKVLEMNTRLAERYQNHPALAIWHLSNEYSGDCYCDLCIARFHHWLEERYGTLENLNDRYWSAFWSHTYTAWDEVEPRDWAVDALKVDWQRFVSWQIGDFIDWEKAPLKRLTPNVPVTTNFMGTFNGVNYAELAKHVDLIADDQYPRMNPGPLLLPTAAGVAFKDDLYRSFKPEVPWMLMESCPDSPQWCSPMKLKRPGVHRAEMLQAIGHGAEGTLYFQWRKGRGAHEKLHGAVVDHVGHEHTRVFRTVADLGHLYTQMAGVIGTRNESQAAVIYDWESKWAFEATSGTPSHADLILNTAQAHHQALWEQGISVDVLATERDFSQYKLLIAPVLWMIKPGVAERMRAFVEAGGFLVGTYYLGTVDDTNRVWTGGLPGDGLKELFGVWNEETDQMFPGEHSTVRGVSGNPIGIEGTLNVLENRAVLHLHGAQVVALYTDEFYANTPAITLNQVGAGHALYVGAELDLEGLRDLYRRVAALVGVRPVVDADFPTGVSVQRRTAEGREFLFMQNFSGQEAPIHVREAGFTNLESGETADRFVLQPIESVVLVR